MDAIDEAGLPVLLERFYERVRRDPLLGPVFAGAVHDWPSHIARLSDFWSSVMLTSGRYKGNPVAMHTLHADSITPDMFGRWLEIWRSTTEELLTPADAGRMQAKAERIAESLKLALHLRTPKGREELLGAPRPYRSTPDFDPDTLPAALRRAHSTKEGVWGVIRLSEGQIRYVLEDGSEPTLLAPGRPGLIRPGELHHVEPVGPFRMQVEFYRSEPRLT